MTDFSSILDGLAKTTQLFDPTGDIKICAVPRSLGHVTGMSVRHGRIVATTQSGVPIIVSSPPPKTEP